MEHAAQQLPTETEGLPEAKRTEIVELGDGDTYDLDIAPVAKRLGDATRADARLQRLDPRPDAEGPAGIDDHRARHEPRRHRRDRALARPAARQPLRRHARDAGADPRSARRSRTASTSPIPASTGTTRTSARTTARRWACTATSSSSPRTRTTGRRSTASCSLTLDDVLVEDGRIAPFSEAETTHVAMGRFGNVMLVVGRTRAVARGQARRGRALLPHEHREHADLQRRSARRTDEARRRRQRPLRARGARRATCCSRRPSVSSSTCCFGEPGELTLEHRTPERTYALATVRVGDEPAEPQLGGDFATLRTNEDMVAERERIRPHVDAPPDKTLAFVAEMDLGSSEEGATSLRVPDASRGRRASGPTVARSAG